jgi:hypothetical protein
VIGCAAGAWDGYDGYVPKTTKVVVAAFFFFFFLDDFVCEPAFELPLACSWAWVTMPPAKATCDTPSTRATRPAKTTETRNDLDMPVFSFKRGPTMFSVAGNGSTPF